MAEVSLQLSMLFLYLPQVPLRLSCKTLLSREEKLVLLLPV